MTHCSEPIVDQSKTLDLQRGDVLFQSGDDSSDLYIVTHGRIAIGNRSFDGRESLVALMESGDLFGEMPLFSNDGRSAEARALEESAVVVIPYQPVKDLYDENPSLLWRVVDVGKSIKEHGYCACGHYVLGRHWKNSEATVRNGRRI